jgi:hypothetical protein
MSEAAEVAIPKGLLGAKRVTARVSLLALGVTFELTSKYVAEMQEEIADWEDGRNVGIGVLPNGPSITIRKEGDRLKYLGSGLQDPEISILFKNLDSALMIFTGQLGSPQAVAENRICVQGNTYKAMQVTRAMAIVQTYLFPGIVLKSSFKRPPKLSSEQLAIKAKIMGLLTPMLLKASFK